MAGAKAQGERDHSRRRAARFPLHAPVDVAVLRSGVPEAVPGRSVNVCERGLAAILAGELVPGETVGVQVHLPSHPDPLLTRATVRYQDKLRCGLEFLALTPEQRAALREWLWMTNANSESDPGLEAAPGKSIAAGRFAADDSGDAISTLSRKKEPAKKTAAGVLLLFLAAVAIAVFWWKWNQGWQELESSAAAHSETTSAQPAPVQVPAETLEKLLIHRVEPVYPSEARQQALQGVIAVDVVVGRDGSVVSMRPLNGPAVLARAAMDALRWWRFEPYRLNGEPTAVETTMAVEFKK